MRLYKLTNEKGQTPDGTQWGEGVVGQSDYGEHASPGWILAYTDPWLAILLNPIHAKIETPLVWEADGDVGQSDYGLKVGCIRLKTICVIPTPQVTMEQRLRFMLLCALKAHNRPDWVQWAENLLSGADRSWEAAAADVATWAAAVAAWAAEVAAGSGQPLDLIALAKEAIGESYWTLDSNATGRDLEREA